MTLKCMEMKRKIEKISKELETIYALEKKFPKGELSCRQNEKRFKWYVKYKEKTTYLPKSKKELAEMLALKKYYAYRKQELEGELAVCRAYIRKMQPLESKTEELLVHPEFGKLLGRYFMPIQEELIKWQNAPYEQCKKHEENLTIKGTQGRMLRPKSEAIIDMMLYKNGIPFRYEEKLVLDGITIYPDFVIRHPKTGEFYYWEHFGMMDDENYMQHACDKIRIYCKSGIIPSVNLIMTYETKKHPFNVNKAESLIQEYFGT